jgi:hypothetical protein
MIRRLLGLSLAIYAVVAFVRARKNRAAERQKDSQAHADWESEGGNPRPESVDVSLPV